MWARDRETLSSIGSDRSLEGETLAVRPGGAFSRTIKRGSRKATLGAIPRKNFVSARLFDASSSRIRSEIGEAIGGKRERERKKKIKDIVVFPLCLRYRGSSHGGSRRRGIDCVTIISYRVKSVSGSTHTYTHVCVCVCVCVFGLSGVITSEE